VERHDLETDDHIHTSQYGESESSLLGSPLIDYVVETDMSMGYLLPGPVYSDEDAFLVCWDGHITCKDTFIWDPGADDISRVSAQEDTVVHIGYRVVQFEATVHDDVQWHRGGFSSTMDNGQYSALVLEECIDEDSTIDISSGIQEVVLQQGNVQESRQLAGQLRVKEDMIMAAIRHIDDTHMLVVEYCWRATMSQDSSDGELAIDEFQTLR
jgi:hypothetical protein